MPTPHTGQLHRVWRDRGRLPSATQPLCPFAALDPASSHRLEPGAALSFSLTGAGGGAWSSDSSTPVRRLARAGQAPAAEESSDAFCAFPAFFSGFGFGGTSSRLRQAAAARGARRCAITSTFSCSFTWYKTRRLAGGFCVDVQCCERSRDALGGQSGGFPGERSQPLHLRCVEEFPFAGPPLNACRRSHLVPAAPLANDIQLVPMVNWS